MRYRIVEPIDPMYFRADKAGAVAYAKRTMAADLADMIAANHAPVQPVFNPVTREHELVFDMEILSAHEIEDIQRNARAWAYRDAREDAKRAAREDARRAAPYGMNPDEQDVI